MKIIASKNKKNVLRFDPGEEVFGILKKFCAKNRIGGGFFLGIGACREAVISYFDAKKNRYEDHLVKENLEIINFTCPPIAISNFCIITWVLVLINGLWVNNVEGDGGRAGNIAVLDKEHIIHAHGSFGDRKLKVAAGHVKKLVVSATRELIVTDLGVSIARRHSLETGLNLLV